MPIPHMDVAGEFRKIVELYQEFEDAHDREPNSKAAQKLLAKGLQRSCKVLRYIMGGGEVMTVDQKERAFETIKGVTSSNERSNFMYAELRLLEALELGRDAEARLEKSISDALKQPGEIERQVAVDWADKLERVTGVICRSADAVEYGVQHRALFRETVGAIGGLLTIGINSTVGAMFLPVLPFAVLSIKAGYLVSGTAVGLILKDFFTQ